MNSRRVLVVDDSAVVRFLMSELLSSVGGFEVDTAADPVFALRKIEDRRPDVLLLDVEMPRMSGFDLLRRLEEQPIPAVILSSHTRRGAALALEAFDRGAVEVMAKPPHGLEQFLRHSAPDLVKVLRTARLPTDFGSGEAPVVASKTLPAAASAAGSEVSFAFREDLRSGADAESRATALDAGCWAIAVGASTGGPQALERLLREAPADMPGMVVVQHMPPGFTTALAQRLDGVGALRVREARDGDPVVPGTVLIAPGDRHLQVAGEPRSLVARLWGGPPVNRHRPSVDVLFESVLSSTGGMAAAVLLSGMGADGVDGMLRLREAGALTLAQSEESCAVFGMPRAAERLGATSELLSPERIMGRLNRWCRAAGELRQRRSRALFSMDGASVGL